MLLILVFVCPPKKGSLSGKLSLSTYWHIAFPLYLVHGEVPPHLCSGAYNRGLYANQGGTQCRALTTRFPSQVHRAYINRRGLEACPLG